MYHIVDSIKSFGAINGFTTETYESLHKEYVKIPYQLINKNSMYLMLYNSNFYFIFSKQKQIISNRFDANQLLNSLKISHQQKLLLYLNLQQNVLNFY